MLTLNRKKESILGANFRFIYFHVLELSVALVYKELVEIMCSDKIILSKNLKLTRNISYFPILLTQFSLPQLDLNICFI